MRNVVKIGCVALFVGGLIMLPAMQAREAQTSGRRYIYSKAPSSQGLPFSEAVLVGDTLYVAGHIGFDQSGQTPADIDQELKLLFEGFRADMAEVNYSMDDLVSVRVYCTDLALYAKFN